MLHRIYKSYLFLGTFLFLFFIPWVEPLFLPYHIVNLASFLTYFLVLHTSFRLKYYGTKEIVSIVFTYGMLIITLYNLISFGYKGNFFLFSEADAVVYDNFARTMAGMPFGESIKYYLQFLGIDDLGVVIVLRSLYLFIDSNLIYNFYNLFIGTATALVIFKISLRVMSQRSAFLCAVAYGISSFVLWFHASGLKETTMVFLVVLFFHQYYLYLGTKMKIYIVNAVLVALVFLLFRPALIGIFIGSVGIGIVFQRMRGFQKAGLIILICVGVFISFPFLEAGFNRFLKGGDFELLIAARLVQGQVVGSLPLSYAANVIAQLVGPFPTIIPHDTYQSFFSPGLIFRMMLAIPFWAGVYYIFQKKITHLYPVVFYIAFEMLALSLILEGLELRKSMPHIPLIFIIAFWFMDFYKVRLIGKKKIIDGLFAIYIICMAFLLMIWNFR